MKAELKKKFKKWRREGGKRDRCKVIKKEYGRLWGEKEKGEREIGEGSRGGDTGGAGVEDDK